MSFSQLVVVGNLGRDPETRFTPAGQTVCNFSIASNRKYTKADGTKVEETTWYRVSVWGKQAEACQTYLKKGRQVLVQGRLIPDENGNPRVFERNDGTHGAAFEVNASTVRFLGSGNGANGAAETEVAEAIAVGEEEIPF